MKNILLFVTVVVLTVGLTVGCSLPNPAQQQAVADQAAAATAQAKALQAQLDGLRTQLQAMTLPSATGTQPTPSAIKAEASAEKAVTEASKGLAVAVPVMTAATGVVQAAASGQNPAGAVAATAPLFGPYAPYVLAGSTLVGLVWGWWQNGQKKKSDAAHETAVAGMTDAINKGEVAVVSAQAALTVNQAANNSPTNDKLVAALANAAPDPVIAAAPVTPKV